MQKNQHFNYLTGLLYSVVKLSLFVLVLMSFSRLYLFLNYGGASKYSSLELLNAFWLGLRLDATVVAYINALVVLIIFIIWLLKLKFLQKYLYSFFRVYFVFFLTLLSFFTFADLTYFSFFGEHSTLMIFGVFDDDTVALIHTALDNYNVALVAFIAVCYFAFIYFMIFKIIKYKENFKFNIGYLKQFGFFVFLILLIVFIARGSVGQFPISHYIADVSQDVLINKLPQSPSLAIIKSYKLYKKSKSGKYDLIKESGYQNNMPKAFEVFKQTKQIDSKNLLNNLVQKTSKNKLLENIQPHVVVVMVESFGMPLLEHQSSSFNIMGRLKKHFDEDIVFTSFISSSNGTVVSLEPLLLNITARPHSTSFAQSSYLNTHFSQASAKVYKDAGYETTFVYGGDLHWRNVGNFMSKQGFESTRGKATIAKSLNKNIGTISHDWGVFDEYLYEYVFNILKNATSPQFIFVLSTNNHPPYTIPDDYKSNSLKISKDLKNHIIGDMELAKRRFKDYAYAVDNVGGFLDRVKNSSLAKKTVVAITADNNTVEGIMKYDDYLTKTKQIPFYIYMPEAIKPKEFIDTTVASSHKDIFPTLYNLTLSDKTYVSIGTNLLDKDKLHCGFNDAGIVISKDGGFKVGNALTDNQKQCQNYYKASLAVTEYLIKSQKK